MNNHRVSIWVYIIRLIATLFFIVLLLLPIVAIYYITDAEMNKYTSIEVPTVAAMSYGKPVQVKRKDIQEYLYVSGTVISAKRLYMELPNLNRQYEARWSIESGDYISEGEVIGKTADGKKDIVASATGYLIEIHLGQYSYLTLEDSEDLVLRCKMKENDVSALISEDANLSNENNDPIELISISQKKNADNTYTVLFRIPDAIYGNVWEKYKIFTGRMFSGALVAPRACVFHLENDPKAWYVRTVTEDGTVLKDIQIKIGFSTEKEVCIVGVEEGAWLDSGYANLNGGGYHEYDAD